MQPQILLVNGYPIKLTAEALLIPGHTIPWPDLLEILYGLSGNPHDTVTPTPLATHRATILAQLLNQPGVVPQPHHPKNTSHNDA